MCVYIYIYIYIHIHPYIHTCIRDVTCIHAYMHTCIHAYTHTCIHAYMHTSIHTYIHTYIYTHTHTTHKQNMCQVEDLRPTARSDHAGPVHDDGSEASAAAAVAEESRKTRVCWMASGEEV